MDRWQDGRKQALEMGSKVKEARKSTMPNGLPPQRRVLTRGPSSSFFSSVQSL